MAGVTFVKRSALPAPVKGKASTMSVTINNNGQIHFSKMVTDFFESAKKIALGFDGLKVYLFKSTAKQAKDVAEQDLITLSYPKAGKDGKVKSTNASFSAAAILRAMKNYGASVEYDYKNSGNQNFACVESKSKDFLVFEIPASGKMEPRLVTPRKKKAAVTPIATVASTPAVNEPVKTEELELDLETA